MQRQRMRGRPPPPPSPPVPPPFASFQFGTLHAVLSFVAILVVRWLWQSWRREAAARAAWERGRALEQAREALSHVLPKRGYTEAELRSYDGVGADRPILLAADGKVFNVTRGQHFYGEDNCYHALAGKDATRLLAKGILRAESEEEATKPLQDHELATLKEWVELYETKCPGGSNSTALIEPHRIDPRACAQVRAARPTASARPTRCRRRTRRRRLADSRDGGRGVGRGGRGCANRWLKPGQVIELIMIYYRGRPRLSPGYHPKNVIGNA